MEEFDSLWVQCPYCFEQVEVTLESDVHGEMVQDCTVCCRPWRMQVRRAGGHCQVELDRAD